MKYFDTAKRWYEKSLLEENPVDRFQCLWIAFNALYGDQPGKFETNQITNFVREHYSSSQDKVLEYKRYFEEPIPNLRILYSTSSKDTRSQIAILERNYEDNEEKIKALLLCVYQVHRNIFCPEGSFATQRYSEEEIIAYASKALEIYLKDFFEHYTDPINSRILQYIDVLIDPNSGNLPTVRGKRRTVAEISDFIKGHKGHLPLLYRYSPADYYNVSALLDGSVYLVSAAHMNDFWEGKVVDSTNPNIDLVETLKKNQEEIYLKSFSSDRNSSVMWQKYAGNYTGLCVTYNFNNIQNDAILSNLYPVQYSNIPFNCNSEALLDNNPYLYLRKSKEWADEKEWRLIYKPSYFMDNQIHNKLDLKECIEAVYFGIGMDSSLQRHIMTEMRKRNVFRSARFYCMNGTPIAPSQE